MVNLYPSRDVRYVADDDGSMLLLHMRTGKYTYLNRTVGRVWQHMVENSATVEQALTAVAPELGVGVERFASDMTLAVAAWRKARIVIGKEVKK